MHEPGVERSYRDATLRPYGRNSGLVVIVRPGKTLHHMTFHWRMACRLIDWSIDTGDDMVRLPLPYVRIAPAVPVETPAPPPSAEPPPEVDPRYRRNASGRLVF